MKIDDIHPGNGEAYERDGRLWLRVANPYLTEARVNVGLIEKALVDFVGDHHEEYRILFGPQSNAFGVPTQVLKGCWDKVLNYLGEKLSVSRGMIAGYLMDSRLDDLTLSNVAQKLIIGYRMFKNRHPTLIEATYKDIQNRIDPGFLKQGFRAEVLTGLKLSGFSGDEMNFMIKSAKHDSNTQFWLSTVRFKEWEDVGSDMTMRPIDRARMLMFSGNIELNCTCPSFLYHGYRYILTQMDAALIPEDRPPVRNNPQQRGVVCKHLNRVLKSFPFYSGDVAKQLREQFGATDGKSATADAKSKKADEIKASMGGLGQGNVITDIPFEEVI